MNASDDGNYNNNGEDQNNYNGEDQNENNGEDQNNNNGEENNDNVENNNPGDKRKGKGRQKITMAKIENETNLQVTFSKRRAGVFKKASELSTLCGAESAVVVFSPGNKPHSFGHPNVEAVANRFLNASSSEGNQPPNPADQLMMAHGEAAIHQRNHELIAIEAELERERQRKRELEELARANPQLNGLTYEELEQMKEAVANFKREFDAKLQSNAAGNSPWANPNPSPYPVPSPYPNPNPNPYPNPNPNPQHQQQGLGFPVFGYGGSNIYPTIPGGSTSFNYPQYGRSGTGQGNYGYTVQYPPFGPGASNYFGDPAAGPSAPNFFGDPAAGPSAPNYSYAVDPAAIARYDFGTGASTGAGTSRGTGPGTGNEDEADPDQDTQDPDTGYHNIYRRSSS